MRYKEKFTQFLLEAGALTFGDFTLKSGRKSPYMINTGKIDSGGTLARLGCFYARAIHEKMELGIIPKDTNILFGSAYKGIPLAAAAAIAMETAFDLNISYSFNRKEAKDHGEGGIFVGRKPGPGDRILVVDDVMTAGTALRDTVDLLRAGAPEAKVIGSVIAVDRKERGRDGRMTAVAELQYELGIPIFSIVDIDEIVAILKGGLTSDAGYDDAGDDAATNDPANDAADANGDAFTREETAFGEQPAPGVGMCSKLRTENTKAALPTEEQIAALETYLAEYRPA